MRLAARAFVTAAGATLVLFAGFLAGLELVEKLRKR